MQKGILLLFLEVFINFPALEGLGATVIMNLVQRSRFKIPYENPTDELRVKLLKML